MHDSFVVQNLDVSIGCGVPMDFDSLANLPSLEDVPPIIDGLQALQHLDSPHCSSEAVLNLLTSKKAYFVDELKITLNGLISFVKGKILFLKKRMSQFKLQ